MEGYVSRRRAWIEQEGGTWTIRIDLGNSNANRFNGKLLEGGVREPLADGDAVSAGIG